MHLMEVTKILRLACHHGLLSAITPVLRHRTV